MQRESAEILSSRIPLSDWIPVSGQSMSPLLQPGDEIQVHWLEKGTARLSPGQIVLLRSREDSKRNKYSPKESWIVHRVIHTDQDCYLIKGDAAFMADQVGEDEIWGSITAVRLSPSMLSLEQSSRKTRVYRPNWLDRCIAPLSGIALGGSRLYARAACKAVRALAWLRRWTL